MITTIVKLYDQIAIPPTFLLSSPQVVMWALTQLIFNEYATAFVGAFILLLFARHRKTKRSTLPLPPGPPRLPAVGSLFQMPLSHLWERGVEWGAKYGERPVLQVPMSIVQVVLTIG